MCFVLFFRKIWFFIPFFLPLHRAHLILSYIVSHFNLFHIMAKAYITQSKRIGSVGGETYSVVNGQTIVRAKPVSVSNPRTDAQMTQRSQFISAVRFFQRATQRFFKFAFESKKSYESDYNAFMRLNAKVGGYITKAQSDAVGFPMIAPFVVSQGSMPSPVYGTDLVLLDTNSHAQMIIATGSTLSAAPTTIAEASALILAEYPQYRNGDIVTLCALFSTATGEFYNDLDAESFRTSGDQIDWKIYQIIIDTTNDAALADSGLSCAIDGGRVVLQATISPINSVAGTICVVSRNEKSGLKVSTCTVALSSVAQAAYDEMRENAHLQMVLAWWGAQQQAVLQGAIAQEQAEPATKKARIVSVDNEYNLPATAQRSVSADWDFILGWGSDPSTVAAEDFRVEGFRASSWSIDLSPDHTTVLVQPSESSEGTVQVYYRNQLIINATVQQ